MLVGRVVDHEVGDDPDAARVRGLGQRLEVGDGADRGVDLAKIGDVVAVVLQGRGVDGHQPEAVDAQLLEVVELRRQADQVAVAVAVGVVETPDVDLVEDGVLVPEAFGSRHGESTWSWCVRGVATRVGRRSRRARAARPASGSSRLRVGHQPLRPGGDPLDLGGRPDEQRDLVIEEQAAHVHVGRADDGELVVEDRRPWRGASPGVYSSTRPPALCRSRR